MIHAAADPGVVVVAPDAEGPEAPAPGVEAVATASLPSLPILPCCVITTAVGDDGAPSGVAAVVCDDRPCPSPGGIETDMASGPERTPQSARGDDPAARRCAERSERVRMVLFQRRACAAGFSTREVAAALAVALRTLLFWCARFAADGLAERARGRPPRCAPWERCAAVTRLLEAHGPSLSLAALKAAYPDVTRAELGSLRNDYRAYWRATHMAERCELEWLCPGSVWAMDFSHPPHRIDGCFPAILNVRDLASHQQLLWLPVEHENAQTVIDALDGLFVTHGAPLVIKCDNGPAFRAEATKGLLRGWSIFGLYSPPYCAWYNGACERANRTLKELTAHLAERAGRAGFWTSDDLLAARLTANRQSRPWGATGATPEEVWTGRRQLVLDERALLWQHLKRGIAAACEQRGLDPTVALPHYTRTEIERIAAQPVLEALNLLHVRRRRIAPVI